MLYILIAAILIVIDQAVKFLVRANIPLGESTPFIPHILSLTYVENTGAAFSILREHTWLLAVVSAAVVVAIGHLVVKKFITGRWGLTAAALVMAGGVGNLIDRTVLGSVTDMFQTEFMDFAVFNVADCCITIGVVMLAVYLLFFYDKTHPKEVQTHDDADLPADGQ